MKVLVIEARGLHLGFFGCYGNDWLSTPVIDRLAAEGVVFDRHYCDNIGADPRPCWTGRYQFPGRGPLDPPVVAHCPNLAEILTGRGIGWHRCVNSPVADAPGSPIELSSVLAGLETVRNQSQWLLWAEWPGLRPPWRITDEWFAQVLGSLPDVEEDEDAALAWLDPPCAVLESLDDIDRLRLQNTYAAVMADFDTQLGDLLDHLSETGLDREVLLCVTAESGLALGEHGTIGGLFPWLHDELVHLPLIVRWPDKFEAGRRVSTFTQPIDLFPTLLEGFGLHNFESQGASLWPMLRGEQSQAREYACCSACLGETIEWALRCPEWAFLLPICNVPADPPRERQLFVKPDDRWEVNNVAQHHLERADELERVLHAFVEETRRPGLFQPPSLDDFAGNAPAVTKGESP